MERSTIPNILMIKDNPADVLLTKLAMKSAGIQTDFIVYETIEEGLDYLEDAPLPNLVLLDINSFEESGTAFLKMIRKHPRFSNLKISILNTSDKYRETYLSLGATFFIVKSMMFEDFVKSLNVLKPIFSPATYSNSQ